MGTMASQITSLTVVCSTVYSGTVQRRHQSSVPLAFVRGIHRWPVNSPHKVPVTRKIVPFDDVIMKRDLSVLGASFMVILHVTGWLNHRLNTIVLSWDVWGGGYCGNFLRAVISSYFNSAKIQIGCWISRLFLMGVAGAQLQRHLSYMNVIQRI